MVRLLDSITNGSHIELSVTGTSLLFNPGLLGIPKGRTITHKLPGNCERGISYFLETLAVLSALSKEPLRVIIQGGSTGAVGGDVSVDTFRAATLPVLVHRFLPEIGKTVECRIIKRCSGVVKNAAAGVGGEVSFVCERLVRLFRTVQITTTGRVKKVRGVAYSTGVGGVNARMIEGAKEVLGPFLKDVYVYSDSGSAVQDGKKRTGVGYGLSLVGETGSWGVFVGEAIGGEGEAAEDVGKRAALGLLEDIRRGGAVGGAVLPWMMVMMALGSEGDVGRMVVGRDSVEESFVSLCRDIKKLTGSEIALRDSDDSKNGELIMSVVGKGVGNVGRKLA